MRYEIVGREYEDHTEALLFANGHMCVTVNGCASVQDLDTGKWIVFELVVAQ